MKHLTSITLALVALSPVAACTTMPEAIHERASVEFSCPSARAVELVHVAGTTGTYRVEACGHEVYYTCFRDRALHCLRDQWGVAGARSGRAM